MEREVIYKRIKSIKELRKFIQECQIQHSEERTKAFYTKDMEMFFYEQGWLDALRTIRDVTGKDGLLMYRYVTKEQKVRKEDKDRDIL